MTHFKMRKNYKKILTSSSGVSYDSNAVTFFNTIGITSTRTKSAVSNLFTGYKSNNLWNKIERAYLMLSDGSNPLIGIITDGKTLNQAIAENSDTSFVIPEGYQFDASNNNSLDSNLIPSTSSIITNTSYHISFYRNDLNDTGSSDELCFAGVSDTLNTLYLGLQWKASISGHYTYGGYNATVASSDFGAVSVTNGYYLVSRTSASALSIYKNGVSVSSDTTPDVGIRPTQSILLGAFNNAGSINNRMQSICGLITIGAGLNSSEQSIMNSLNSTFQANVISGGR